MSNEMHIKPRHREVNNLLDFNSEDIIFVNDNSKNENQNRQDQNDSRGGSQQNGNNLRRNEFKDFFETDDHQKNKNDDKHQKKFDNPVDKLIREDPYHDKASAYKALVKHDGLYKMIKDLKDWSKNPKDKKRPFYIQNCLKDIAVAAALSDAINVILKDNKYDIEKKDFDLFIDELLTVVKTSEEDRSLHQKYNQEAIDAMREAYISILYRFNKKKLKKLEKLDLPEDISKKIIVLTAGKNPNSSIYSLLKFFYRNAKRIEMSEKLLVKIFKVCYGKDKLPIVIKCIMNEKVNPVQTNPLVSGITENSPETRMYVLIDKLMRDELEGMGKKDCKNTILSYVKERKIAKKRGDMTRRRFGDRRVIHPEDYPRLTEVLENLEADDFSIIEYLR